MKASLISFVTVLVATVGFSAYADDDKRHKGMDNDHYCEHEKQEGANNDHQCEHEHMMNKEMSKKRLKRMNEVDTDDDGKISKDEYMKNAEARFDKQDLDSDGYISDEEKRSIRKKIRDKFREGKEKHRRTMTDKKLK